MSAKETTDELAAMPPHMAMMRRAAMAAVTQEDLTEIFKAQVNKAKSGDQQALKFVCDYMLGGSSMKGATFIQNVYPDRPDQPTAALPGTTDKVRVMQKRAAAGLPLTADGDGGKPDLR